MENLDICKHIDHTLLKPTATWKEIEKLCLEAIEFNTASVCIPPSFVKRAHEAFPKLNICTVIGFPHGYNDTDVKLLETMKAIDEGANEIDMVINLGDVKDGEFDNVLREISILKIGCDNHILKVIIETCYLTEEEKIKLCEIVTEAKADYIKTSTGFGTAGAILADIKLFKEHIGPNVKIKAAGGIKTKEDIDSFLKEGAERLGSSSALKILGLIKG